MKLASVLVIMLCPVVVSGQRQKVPMEELHVDSFTLVGLTARTTNAKEASGNGAIGQLWARLRSEGLLARIKHRADNHIVAVYSDYESDKDGAYTYTLGAKVTSAKDVPPGMVARRTESGNYAIFTDQGGPPAQLVIGLWQKIWSLEKASRKLRRAYRTDFEIYLDPDANDADQKVDIYIGLRRD